MHVVRPAQIGAINLAVIVARKRITPFGEAVQLFPDRVQRALDPSRVGETASARHPRGDSGLSPFAGRRRPRAGIGRRGRAACPDIALVDQDDARLGLSRGNGRPCCRGAPADDQHIGGHVPGPVIAPSHLCISVPAMCTRPPELYLTTLAAAVEYLHAIRALRPLSAPACRQVIRLPPRRESA